MDSKADKAAAADRAEAAQDRKDEKAAQAAEDRKDERATAKAQAVADSKPKGSADVVVHNRGQVRHMVGNSFLNPGESRRVSRREYEEAVRVEAKADLELDTETDQVVVRNNGNVRVMLGTAFLNPGHSRRVSRALYEAAADALKAEAKKSPAYVLAEETANPSLEVVADEAGSDVVQSSSGSTHPNANMEYGSTPYSPPGPLGLGGAGADPVGGGPNAARDAQRATGEEPDVTPSRKKG
jgi:hypothetical protein